MSGNFSVISTLHQHPGKNTSKRVVEDGTEPCSSLFDLSAAFDTVDHRLKTSVKLAPTVCGLCGSPHNPHTVGANLTDVASRQRTTSLALH